MKSEKPKRLNRERRGIKRFSILFITLVLIISIWLWRQQTDSVKSDNARTDAVQVVSAVVAKSNVSVRLDANGIVSAQQTVDIRPQLSATVKTVHIREGQFVQKGDKLFTLDARTESANLNKTEGRLAKSRAELKNAERNLERQRELFRQGFISQAALDRVQNQVDGLRGQLEFDQATVEAMHVARSFTEITAPIAGRTGAIPVHQGSLVLPNDPVMVSITQIDPINITFMLPERELAALQKALRQDKLPVSAILNQTEQQGWLTFLDNAVDTASGTIRLKAQFSNTNHDLWPGMFVKVMLAPRSFEDVLTVPVQAVQTGPEKKFLYVITEDSKVISQPVDVRLIQDGFAVIAGENIIPGMRVVTEGAQNLRPGSQVAESSTYHAKIYANNQVNHRPNQPPQGMFQLKTNK